MQFESFHIFKPTHTVTLRDGNSGTGTRYPLGTRLDGYRYRYRDNFLPMGGTRTRPELRRVRDGFFFSPDGYPILYYRYNYRL
jgi:hypothetical protein